MFRDFTRCLVPAACLFAAAAPASAQAGYGRIYPWTSGSHLGQFEPSYLVVCTPSPTTVACPADGMALLPDPLRYTNLTLQILGGPFTQRYEVENMRAALVRRGMPTHALYIVVVDSAGRTLGGFWLGARPTCVDLYGQGRLEGEVSADLSPTGARPPTLPLSENALSAYVDYVEQIRPRCQERRSQGRPSTIPEGMPNE
ncbi:MAG TPA: hypothetical protein VEC11_02975 [Allosphingosinicella sp.]|nr:hypothetical protein [Allosphingosinicella sp.]